jgi:hypothetical protein
MISERIINFIKKSDTNLYYYYNSVHIIFIIHNIEEFKIIH